MAEDWSRAEIVAIVADYFAMLGDELAGRSVNKAAHNRALQPLLRRRSAASIEFKHANLSAILVELGYPYIDGYKPRGNYQELLRDVVIERLSGDRALGILTETVVDAPVVVQPAVENLTSVIVPPPRGSHPSPFDRPAARTAPRRDVNYLEREARNHSLGAAGEDFVLKVEHARLVEQGSRRWADRLEHVSRTQGDGLGYDIRSFEPDGTERLIEVKTTRFGAMTPFFATSNEVEISEGHGERYHLYRVFRFEKTPRMFILAGSLRQSVILHPAIYRASLP